MKRSNIGWADYSGGILNVVTGCTKVSEGCRNCYGETIYERFGKDFSRVTVHEDHLDAWLRWNPPPENNKRPLPSTRPIAFVSDTGDMFHPDVPAPFVTSAFDVMAFRQSIDWVVLTKRPQEMRETLFGKRGDWYLGGGDYIRNVWLGVSVEDQENAEKRMPILAEYWQGVRVVSVEPMLGPVDLTPWISDGGKWWVLAGGESGPNRRLFRTEWVMDLLAQCRKYKVPFFFKQGSGLYPGMDDVLPGVGMVKEWPR